MEFICLIEYDSIFRIVLQREKFICISPGPRRKTSGFILFCFFSEEVFLDLKWSSFKHHCKEPSSHGKTMGQNIISKDKVY